MKTPLVELEDLRAQAQSYRIQNNGPNIDVYKYFTSAFNNNNYVIEINSEILQSDNFHLLINNRHLKLIVSEIKEINRPIYAHHYSKQRFEKRSYECLRTFTIKLPNSSDFFIDQSLFDPERKVLRVMLKQHLN